MEGLLPRIRAVAVAVAAVVPGRNEMMTSNATIHHALPVPAIPLRDQPGKHARRDCAAFR